MPLEFVAKTLDATISQPLKTYFEMGEQILVRARKGYYADVFCIFDVLNTLNDAAEHFEHVALVRISEAHLWILSLLINII